LLLIGILLGVAAGGIFGYLRQGQPIYTASAQILVDQSIFYHPSIQPASVGQNTVSASSPSNLTALLLSDVIRQKTAGILGTDAASIPTVSVTPDPANDAIYTITIQTTNAQDAVRIVNAWADAEIDWAKQTLQTLNDEETKALVGVENADQALVEYLKQNGLSQLTWSDLEVITGVEPFSGTLQLSTQPLPDISTAQRLEIAKLMQARITAQTEYAYDSNMAIQSRYALAFNKPMVLRYATSSTTPIKQSMVRNVTLGAGVGLILAICWIFLQEWWQKGGDENRKEAGGR